MATELYLFDSGTLALGGVEVPVPFYLLRHSEGTVVVDGGNPLAVAQDARRHWGGLADVFEVNMGEEQHCVPQLQQLGVEPGEVTHVVQTHLHIDHTGALGHFPSATVLVHARELDAARAVTRPIVSGYRPQDYESPDIRWQQVEGEFDVFDDSSIVLLETPGHSAGHMSVLVALDQTGPVLLTADATDNRAQWEGRAPLRGLFSPELASQSCERLRALARDTGAMVVFGHDPRDWAKHRHAPEGYS